jgi:hypothetical protein
MDWLQGLPYPWCQANGFMDNAPSLENMDQVMHYLKS